MKKGIHVMLEKPAGVYTKQVREMNEEAKKHDVVFGIMFNQRTNHIYRKMHELVHSGQYGQIRRTNTEPFAQLGYIQIIPETDGLDTQHIGVLNAWAEAILHGEPLVAKGCEGINSLTISNAMHLSDWTKQMITLPLDEDLFYNELMKRVDASRAKNQR